MTRWPRGRRCSAVLRYWRTPGSKGRSPTPSAKTPSARPSSRPADARVHGFRVRRFATPRNDSVVSGRFARTSGGVEVEELDGVAGPDLVLLVGGHIGVDLVDDRPRIRPFVLDMRKIGGEHDVVDPDMMPLLDRDPLVLHREVDVFADVVARQFLKSLKS